MKVTPEDITRVVEFRERLVKYANYVVKHAHKLDYGEVPSKTAKERISQEQSGLAQDYGRIHRRSPGWGRR